jgi:chromosome segregation ATPase
MENSNIHKSLLELEGSLKDLQSARTQVNSFSVKSEQMLDVYTKILHHLESLQTKFEKENAHLLNLLTQKYEKVSNAISSKSNTLEEMSAKYIDMLSNSYIKVQQKINDLEYSINDAKDKIDKTDFNKSLKEFESKLEIINKYILSFNKELDEFRKSVTYNIQSELKKNTDNYNNLINKVNNAISESNKILKETQDYLVVQKNKIDELNHKVDTKFNALSHYILDIDNKIEKLIEKNHSLKKQNKIIVGISVGTFLMCLVILILSILKN